MKINCIVIDDEAPAIEQMVDYIGRVPFLECMATFDNTLDAFNLDVTDYLLKPISFDRFIQSIEKVYGQFSSGDQVTTTTWKPAPRSWFFVRTEFRMQRIEFDDILFIEGMKEYLGIQTRTERIMVLQSFAGIQKSLPDENFFRVHKSFIVAINKVDRVERNQIFVGSHVIPLSDTYKAAFMKYIF
jgi:two-component system, LytTR family, response regulator